MKVKRIFLIEIINLLILGNKIFAQTSIQNLILLAMQNNDDIIDASLSYESYSISEQSFNGIFTPSLSINTTTMLSKNYDCKINPSEFSSALFISQPIPGNFVLSMNGSFSFSTYDEINSITKKTLRYMKQNPSLSFTLPSSLLPFWVQGTIYDPSVLSLKQQKQYAYNQLLYTKKQVIENLLQNYCYVITSERQIQIYENSISLVQKQINALKELQQSGNVSLSRITELENTKWSYQQDLISVVVSYEGYLQTLKNLCGSDFDYDSDFLYDDVESFLSFVFDQLNGVSDPCLENLQLTLQMLETSRIAQKQASVPTLTLSIAPSFVLNETKENEWKNAWKTDDTNKSWSASIEIDFSPLFTSISKNNSKHTEIDFISAKKNLKNYSTQKDFLQKQFSSIIQTYESQIQTVSVLVAEGQKELEDIKIQYKTGAISALDYYSVEIQVKNSLLSKECLEIKCLMYRILKEMNK